MAIGDLELGLAQPRLGVAGMLPALQAELPAVPRTHDVLFLLVILQHAGVAVLVDRLLDPAVDTALAHRPLQMSALVVPGDKLAVDLEHADLGAVTGNHLAAAFGKLVDAPDHVRFHLERFPGATVLLAANLSNPEDHL